MIPPAAEHAGHRQLQLEMGHNTPSGDWRRKIKNSTRKMLAEMPVVRLWNGGLYPRKTKTPRNPVKNNIWIPMEKTSTKFHGFWN